MAHRLFRDRSEAGRELAKELASYTGLPNTLVLALPRGGVIVADTLSQALSLPMDIWLVRKLGAPWHEELAIGAISTGGISHRDNVLIEALQIPDRIVQEIIIKETVELERRNTLYRQSAPPPDVKGKNIILVDDGIATGSTMRAAVLALREAGAGRIIVAVPVGAPTSCASMRDAADEVICKETPEEFYGVGQWYEDFTQTSDEEVIEILARHASKARET